jgi:hypothetical protein
MKTSFHLTIQSATLAALAALLTFTSTARAQVTNWVAYNDHRRSPPSQAGGWAVTSPRATSYDMGAPGDTAASTLTNFLTGNGLTATVSFIRTGTPDDFPTVTPPPTNTPMGRLFNGICDLSNLGCIGTRAAPPNASDSYVTINFAGLDPAKRYVFRGAGVRNGGYGFRWSVATISASGWSDAHINGNGGPGVLTAVNFPTAGTNLGPGQAAWNAGANPEGAVVGWNDVAPFVDGTFNITVKQYTKEIPGGTATGSTAGNSYSFGALMLAEVEIVAPTITANPPPSTTVEQNRPFSLSVAASGAPLNYQWYKEGLGEIPSATLATYAVPLAQVTNSGSYYAVVYNSLARRTSTVAQVTVFADMTAPTVETIFSYPTVDAGGAATLDQIIVEFNEPVTPASVSSPANYTVPGGGNPVSVIVTNERSVVLVLNSPLAQDSDYSVTLSGATDVAGNVAGSSSAPFHSWVSGIGNGLLMESYNVEDASLFPESVLADPDYPNNPFRRDTLRVFDTRLVFADDTQEGYGARIRGVFIPPVSGNWVFFARMPVYGVVYLNPNGLDEAGKREILRQSTQNPPYNWDRLSSSLYALRAGRAYYIEGLYKAVAGPDFFKVAARLAGTGVPTPVDTLDTQVDANSMAGGYIGFPLAPKDLGGTLSLAQDLADKISEENNLATFSVQLNNPSKLPLQYQWFRDGAEIPGANGPTYTIYPTIAADNGATFSVRVAKVGSFVTSRTATLTVVPDVTRPRALEASNSFATLRFITVRFNEPLYLNDAQESFNYSITDLVTIGGTLQPDRSTVIVEMFADLVPGQTYQLKVESVTDLAGLTIDPNPTFLTFIGASDLPKLTIARNFDYADISWPITSPAFTLEQTDELSSVPGGTVWADAGATPSIVNGRNFVSLSIGPGKKFFRLRQ